MNRRASGFGVPDRSFATARALKRKKSYTPGYIFRFFETNMSDGEIGALERQAKEELFNSIVEETHDLLTTVVRTYARGESRRDLYQDILLRIWRSLDGYSGRSSYSTWVYRIALNAGSTFLVDERRHSAVSIDDVPESALTALPPMDRSQTLQRFIRTLPDDEREVFRQYLGKARYREIAGITQLNEKNLRMRIRRLKRRFAAFVGS